MHGGCFRRQSQELLFSGSRAQTPGGGRCARAKRLALYDPDDVEAARAWAFVQFHPPSSAWDSASPDGLPARDFRLHIAARDTTNAARAAERKFPTEGYFFLPATGPVRIQQSKHA